MKKILKLFSISIVLLLCACTNKSDKLEIKFKSNPSTGYTWKYTVSNKDVIDIKEAYDDSNCPKDVTGCGGQMIYTINPKKEGKTTIKFRYLRPWDESTLWYTATYEITVDKDLKVSEKHSGSYFEKK